MNNEWNESELRELLDAMGQEVTKISNNVTGNSTGDWGNVAFYRTDKKTMHLKFETPELAQQGFSALSAQLTNPYEFGSRFDIMPRVVIVQFTE